MGRTAAEAYEVGVRRVITTRLQLVRVRIRLELVFLLVGLVVGCRFRNVAAVTAAVAGLELLEELVALGVVDRQVVVDEDPVSPLELLEIEDLVVERR